MWQAAVRRRHQPALATGVRRRGPLLAAVLDFGLWRVLGSSRSQPRGSDPHLAPQLTCSRVGARIWHCVIASPHCARTGRRVTTSGGSLRAIRCARGEYAASAPIERDTCIVDSAVLGPTPGERPERATVSIATHDAPACVAKRKLRSSISGEQGDSSAGWRCLPAYRPTADMARGHDLALRAVCCRYAADRAMRLAP